MIRQVGHGGVGTVLQARRQSDQAWVAIKTLRPELVRQADAAYLFWHGVGVNRRLTHPRIVPVLDSGEAVTGPYFVMPWLAGGTLRDWVANHRRITLQCAVRFARELAAILAAMHEAGVVHRDVTTGNVLLDDSSDLWLGDFDVAGEVANSQPRTSTGHHPTSRQRCPLSADGGTEFVPDFVGFAAVVGEMLAWLKPDWPNGNESESGSVQLPSRRQREDPSAALATLQTVANRFSVPPLQAPANSMRIIVTELAPLSLGSCAHTKTPVWVPGS